MRVLITGSSGQIGTNLGLGLLALGHDVFGVDVRPKPWTETRALLSYQPQTSLREGIFKAVTWNNEWAAKTAGSET